MNPFTPEELKYHLFRARNTSAKWGTILATLFCGSQGWLWLTVFFFVWFMMLVIIWAWEWANFHTFMTSLEGGDDPDGETVVPLRKDGTNG